MITVNEASWDRVVRIVFGIALLGLGWTGIVDGGLGVFFKYIGFLPLVTGVIGWRPLCTVLRFSTRTV